LTNQLQNFDYTQTYNITGYYRISDFSTEASAEPAFIEVQVVIKDQILSSTKSTADTSGWVQFVAIWEADEETISTTWPDIFIWTLNDGWTSCTIDYDNINIVQS